MLYKLAQTKFRPVKYFSIDRVFRNENIDATHLAEFHQVEGFVADYNLNLGDLFGVIQTFFSRIGIPDIRFLNQLIILTLNLQWKFMVTVKF